jgi:hypothetical protein
MQSRWSGSHCAFVLESFERDAIPYALENWLRRDPPNPIDIIICFAFRRSEPTIIPTFGGRAR